MADDERVPESFARRLFEQSIDEGRAAELLECLWSGGSATIDLTTGTLVVVPPTTLDALMGES